MNNWKQVDQQHIWHPFTPLRGSAPPLFIESGNGACLQTSDGRRIIDAVSSWWVNLHGHGHPKIADAIAAQARTLEHVIFAGFTHEPAITLTKNLLQILPNNHSKIFFSDNGSTAVEVALKMAIQYWHNQKATSRRKIIAIDGGYHGDTFGAMSAGGRGLFTDPFAPYLFDVAFINFPHPGDEGEVFKQFVRLIEKGDAGIFIFEPLVQGAAGMRIYDANLLDRMISAAQDRDILCIADEVFTGFGRMGKLFASDYLSAKPDIIALSKGITGGALPLGVTTCSQKIANAFDTDELGKTFFHGHSYTANPLACAAANASFTLLMSDDCQKAIQRISESHAGFVARLNGHPHINRIGALGTILSLELKTSDKNAYSNPVRKKVYEYFLNRNILLRPLGNVIYILPPYVISDKDLASVYDAIEDFLNE